MRDIAIVVDSNAGVTKQELTFLQDVFVVPMPFTIDGEEYFEETNLILTKIGLKARNFQENRRHQYRYKGVEIDIDTWPLIPTYLEIEGENEEKIKEVCEDLSLDFSKSTTMDVTDIYKKVYNIDILKIKVLKFDLSDWT